MTARATMPFPARLKTELRIDSVMMLISMALLFGGFVILASASITMSDSSFGEPFFYVERQLVAALIGGAAAFACLFVPMRVWQRLSPLMLLIAIALLCLVLVPGLGHEVNGSTRWVRFGVINLQVSEPARLCLIIYLAGYVVRQQKALRERFVGFLRPMLVLTVSCALLLAQPDFGAAIVLLAMALIILFVGGARIRDFLLFFSIASVAMTVLAITSTYRMRRLTGFLDPWSDPFDSGFQLTQSLIAIGRGEWIGVGLGGSVQKLFYLPEAHTDFVFSIWAEETGFVGAVAVIGLFAALIGKILWAGRRAFMAENTFGAYLCYGVALVFSGQAFVNMGVSSGLLPTKGLTLPFVSYGGTSLIVCCAMLGMVLRIDRDSRLQPWRRRSA